MGGGRLVPMTPWKMYNSPLVVEALAEIWFFRQGLRTYKRVKFRNDLSKPLALRREQTDIRTDLWRKLIHPNLVENETSLTWSIVLYSWTNFMNKP